MFQAVIKANQEDHLPDLMMRLQFSQDLIDVVQSCDVTSPAEGSLRALKALRSCSIKVCNTREVDSGGWILKK